MGNKKTTLLLVVVLIISILILVFYEFNKNTNKIKVSNSTDIKFDKMEIVFGGEQNIVTITSGEKIDIPDRFEAGIYLRLYLNGTQKEYIIKGYYGTYEMKYIKVKILDENKTGSLDGVTIEVSE